MIFDSHVHTSYSFDSEMTQQAAYQQAQEMGYGLITTDHMDLMFEQEQFTFDAADYFANYGQYRSDSFLLGIELGMQLKSAAVSKALIEKYSFDYVIGSLHVLYDTDLYLKSVYQNREKQAVYDCYFQTMLDCLKEHSYINALGHIDYICRYSGYAPSDINYKEHQEYIDAVLKFVIEQGIALEINSRRLGERQAIKYLQPIYRQYRLLGGHFVTIGSDAHSEAGIGNNFQAALDLAAYNDLRPVYFKNGKMEFM